MIIPREKWSDEKVEIIIGNLLRFGVILSATVVFVGALVYLGVHGRTQPHYKVFLGESAEFRTLAGIWKEASSLKGRGLIQLGLLLLIATPVARVAFSVVAFALERDRMYVVITLVVLAVLLYSLMGGPR